MSAKTFKECLDALKPRIDELDWDLQTFAIAREIWEESRAALLADRPEVAGLMAWLRQDGYSDEMRQAAGLIERQQARIAELEKALIASKIPHADNDEDCWYSCPKSGHCCNSQLPDDFCNCGADAHNARIDAAMGRK